MKLIKPSFEILEPNYTFDDIKKHIELCGRTCYKSEDKITETSSSTFMNHIKSLGHTSVLEHGTIYLTVPLDDKDYESILNSYQRNKYSEIRTSDDIYDKTMYITTNYRVIYQNNWERDLKYLSKPTEYHAKRISVRFICNRQVSHEFVRHRVFSFSQESTRYCNYSKDKFRNELTFILPCWLYEYSNNDLCIDEDGHWDANTFYRLPQQSCIISSSLGQLQSIEASYKTLIENNWKPQQAATILPNALKTELVMTGFIDDWKHFFELRCAANAHPQARELACALRDEFINRNYINL